MRRGGAPPRAGGGHVPWSRAGTRVVYPHDASLPGPIRVPPTQMARDGDLVKVRLGVGADLLDPGEGLFGEVAGSLGQAGRSVAPRCCRIAFSQGFSDEFPPEVMDEADRIRLEVSEEEARGEGRRDLRTHAARHHRRRGRARLRRRGLRRGRRATAGGWWWPSRTCPTTCARARALDARGAAPRHLRVPAGPGAADAAGAAVATASARCSPDEDRLCMVADMAFDRAAASRATYELYPAVMRSAARCTYNEVQDVLDGKDVPHRNALQAALRAAAGAGPRADGDARGARRHRLRPARAQGGARRGRPARAHGAARAQGQPPADRGVHAGRQRGGGALLPGRGPAHGLPLPRRAGRGEAGRVRRAGARRTASSCASRTAMSLEGAERASQAARGPPGAARAQPAAAALDDAGRVLVARTSATTAWRRSTTCTSPRPSAATRTCWCTGCSRRTGRGRGAKRSDRRRWSARRSAARGAWPLQCSERERAAMQVEREVVAFYARAADEGPRGRGVRRHRVRRSPTSASSSSWTRCTSKGLVKAETLGPGRCLRRRRTRSPFSGGRRRHGGSASRRPAALRRRRPPSA